MVAAAAPSAATRAAPPPWIRVAVRDVLERAPQYGALSVEDRRALAQAMVKVSTLAAELIAEEGQAEGEIERRAPARPAPPLSTAQAAQPEFGAAADRIADTTRNVLNAVSFPRFVTDLINGVFRAMVDANQQQMNQYVQLLNAVSASAEGFERAQFGLAHVRQWVADHFPESIEYDAPDPEDMPKPGEKMDPDDLADLEEELANIKLRLRPGASMPGAAEIRATLGMSEDEPIEASNPEQLVPFARRYLARQRQQQLATMVMLGMQRIVIDSGKINASMRFHIDTRSAASEDKGNEFGMKNRVKAGGSFGVGPWGASAEVENTISYVSTQRNQNTEEINTDLELNSSVELNFHTDYLPLNQMAAQAQADRIRNNTLNPSADFPDPTAARTARLQAQQASEQQRRAGIDKSVAEAAKPLPPSPATPPPAPAARTTPPASPPANAPAPAPANPNAAPNPNTGGRTTTTPPPANAPATNAPATNAPATNTPTTNAPATNAPATNTAATNAPAANASAGAGSGVGTTVGAQVGAVAGGAAGTAAGTAIAGAIGAAAGGAPAAVTGPIGGAIGGAVGSAVGSAVGGAVGGAVESAVGDLLKSK
ncbi:MAG: hypothetical protein ACOY82_07715 [Pseudomonadota bacterium]